MDSDLTVFTVKSLPENVIKAVYHIPSVMLYRYLGFGSTLLQLSHMNLGGNSQCIIKICLCYLLSVQ